LLKVVLLYSTTEQSAVDNSRPYLAGALLSFKWPTRPHQTATVPIICSFHLGVRQMLLLPEF